MKIHILDSTLIDKKGHHYEYVKSIFDELVSRDISTSVYCHVKAEKDIREYFHAILPFTRDIHSLVKPFPKLDKLNLAYNLLSANITYYKDLKKIDLSRVGNSDIVLVHTINPNQLFGLYFWYLSIKSINRPFVIVLFRYGIGDNPRMRRNNTILYRFFFFLILKLKENKVIFSSDSTTLSAEYKKLSGIDFFVFPIPHLPSLPNNTINKKDFLTITYFGDARVEKGYCFLPYTINDVLSKNNNIRFIIQSNLSETPSKEILNAKDQIRFFRDNVTIIDKPLESNEYYHLLSQTDAVLLPYNPDIYHGRTSGILAEAIAFGKPAIVTKGTWLEQQVLEYNQCGVVMDNFRDMDLSNAIHKYIANHREYDERAKDASTKWNAFHNAKMYIDMIMESVFAKQSSEHG